QRWPPPPSTPSPSTSVSSQPQRLQLSTFNLAPHPSAQDLAYRP
ncbi:unnamed protein product, partial [Tilletia controversa]